MYLKKSLISNNFSVFSKCKPSLITQSTVNVSNRRCFLKNIFSKTANNLRTLEIIFHFLVILLLNEKKLLLLNMNYGKTKNTII